MIVLSFILVLNNMEDSSLQPLGMGKLIQAILDLIFVFLFLQSPEIVTLVPGSKYNITKEHWNIGPFVINSSCLP